MQCGGERREGGESPNTEETRTQAAPSSSLRCPRTHVGGAKGRRRGVFRRPQHVHRGLVQPLPRRVEARLLRDLHGLLGQDVDGAVDVDRVQHLRQRLLVPPRGDRRQGGGGRGVGEGAACGRAVLQHHTHTHLGDGQDHGVHADAALAVARRVQQRGLHRDHLHRENEERCTGEGDAGERRS